MTQYAKFHSRYAQWHHRKISPVQVKRQRRVSEGDRGMEPELLETEVYLHRSGGTGHIICLWPTSRNYICFVPTSNHGVLCFFSFLNLPEANATPYVCLLLRTYICMYLMLHLTNKVLVAREYHACIFLKKGRKSLFPFWKA